jgi:hypothetical protein
MASPMPTMKLIAFPDFPAHERLAALGVLHRLGLRAGQVCITRVEPAAPQDAALPSVVLVSAPGWWHAYEGEDWVQRLERDLAPLAPSASSRRAELQAP